MNLSELITYRNSLNFDVILLITSKFKDEINLVRDVLSKKDIIDKSLKNNFDDSIDETFNSFNNVLKSLQAINIALQDEIKSQSHTYLSRSYDIYNDLLADDAEYILQRAKEHSIYNNNTIPLVSERILLYNNWKYAAAYIRPALAEVKQSMVSFDPLYIIDTDVKLFAPIKNSFSTLYQNRLLYNTINLAHNKKFKFLPKNQLGFIFISDFFNYMPFEIIKEYLLELNEYLRPGGVIMFTYNNGDLASACLNTEHFFKTYVPKHLLLPFIETLQFKILHTHDTELISWIEIKKPGKLTSIKGGQTLAKINI